MQKLRAVRRERLCIVMTCQDSAEARQVQTLVSQVNNGVLVTYRKPQDLLLNYPAGRVVLIILATAEEPADMGRTLAWMRHRWPHCPVTVIGDEGGGEVEVVARAGGAVFLTRPVDPTTWESMVHHVLRMGSRVAWEAELG
ncbi:MAG: hypothetical protein ACYS5V_11725 [Planctomycetota bacterium]